MLLAVSIVGCIGVSRSPNLAESEPEHSQAILCDSVLPQFLSDITSMDPVIADYSSLLLYPSPESRDPREGQPLSTCLAGLTNLRVANGDTALTACDGWTRDDGLLVRHLGGWTDGSTAMVEIWFLTPAGFISTGELRLKVWTYRSTYRRELDGRWVEATKLNLSEHRTVTVKCPGVP